MACWARITISTLGMPGPCAQGSVGRTEANSCTDFRSENGHHSVEGTATGNNLDVPGRVWDYAIFQPKSGNWAGANYGQAFVNHERNTDKDPRQKFYTRTTAEL